MIVYSSMTIDEALSASLVINQLSRSCGDQRVDATTHAIGQKITATLLERTYSLEVSLLHV